MRVKLIHLNNLNYIFNPTRRVLTKSECKACLNIYIQTSTTKRSIFFHYGTAS